MVGRVRDARPADSLSGADAIMLSEDGNRRDESKDGCCSNCKTTSGIFAKYVLVRGVFFTLYILDIASDVNAAYRDYIAGDIVFAAITMGLVFAPGCLFALYMGCQSCLLYAGELSCFKSVLWILMSPLLPLWPVFRGGYLIFMGIICTLVPKTRKKIMPRLDGPSREHLVRFLEGFLEAAPQLIVRLYRVALRNPQHFSDLTGSEITQITLSLLSLSLKIVSTHKKSVTTTNVVDGELEHEGKFRLSWYVQLFAFVWWNCFLLSRCEALALFTASYGVWILLVVGLHILLMFFLQVASDVHDTFRRIIIYFFGAFVFVFTYVEFNLKSRVKRAVWLPYTIFTVIIFVEDSIMLLLWYLDQRSTFSNLLAANTTEGFSNYTQNSSTHSLVLSDETFAPLGNVSSSGNDTSDHMTTSYGEYFFLGTEDTLKWHWEVLLFIHYGVFSIGLIFMVITFITGGVREGSDTSSEHKEHEEMVSITKIEQQSVLS